MSGRRGWFAEQEALDGVDGERARFLASGMAAHAVGDDEQAQRIIAEVCVLIGLSLFSDIGAAERPDTEGS
jgi:hypothetical protein